MYAITESTYNIDHHLMTTSPFSTECLYQCNETPQLIYADHGSGAHMDGSIYTIGVSKIGVRSPDNYGTSRGQGNYQSVNQSAPWNVCLKAECVQTGTVVSTVNQGSRVHHPLAQFSSTTLRSLA